MAHETSRRFRESSRKRKVQSSFILNITALLDILVILIFFLLKSYSTDPAQINTVSSIKLPESTSTQKLIDAVSMTVTQEGVYVDNQKIIPLENGIIGNVKRDGKTIVPLYDALRKAAENAKFIAKNSKDLKFDGKITLQADKKLRFHVLKDIMMTAGQAEYEEFKFLVLKSE